jgi:hypothetical protein
MSHPEVLARPLRFRRFGVARTSLGKHEPPKLRLSEVCRFDALVGGRYCQNGSHFRTDALANGDDFIGKRNRHDEERVCRIPDHLGRVRSVTKIGAPIGA